MENERIQEAPNEARAMAPRSQPVAVPTPGGALLPKWWTDAYGPGMLYKTTLNLDSKEQRQMLLKSVNEDCVDGIQRINTTLNMIGYTLSPARKEIDGEIREWLRCVIHEADGTNVAFGAESIVRALMMIDQLERQSPWYPPLIKMLKVRKLDNGGNWYLLVDSSEVIMKAK